MKEEYIQPVEELSKNPFLGKFIGNNCYKIRLKIASKGKGKSGGTRVITYVQIIKEAVYLLTVYDKSAQEKISDAELLKILNIIP